MQSVDTKVTSSDYTGVDLFKFIMAFAVIAIHSRLQQLSGESDWPQPIGYIISLAVPFFFITSGFLLAQKLSVNKYDKTEQRNIIRKRAYSIFRIFLCWLIIYLPIAIYSYISDNTMIWKAVGGYIYKILTGGHSIWAWQLWFIYSMGWIFLIYSITLISKRSVILLMVLFTIISLVNIGFKDYDILMFRTPYILTHSTLGGGMCITAGVMIYQSGMFDKSFSYTLVLGVISILLYIFGMPYYEITGGSAVFLLALGMSLKSNFVFLMLRRLSMWIYYLHMIVIFCISQSMPIENLTLVEFYITASILTLLLSITIDYCQRNIPCLEFLGLLIK